jgi:hypothetical protein
MILPRTTEINKAKTEERRRQIDEGMALAHKVDLMREMKQEQEYQLMQWRDVTLKGIHAEIAVLTQERDQLTKEIQSATRERNKLLEPLTLEWEALHIEKDIVTRQKNELFLDEQRFQEKVAELDQEIIRAGKIVGDLKDKESDLNKKEKETERLHTLAKVAYQNARQFEDDREVLVQARLKEVLQLKEEYEVALTVIKIREQPIDEKEEELIIRERELARRTKKLQQVESIQ